MLIKHFGKKAKQGKGENMGRGRPCYLIGHNYKDQ
jgi:hypothetical protein